MPPLKPNTTPQLFAALTCDLIQRIILFVILEYYNTSKNTLQEKEKGGLEMMPLLFHASAEGSPFPEPAVPRD
jgi:hypothetical protein